MSLPRQTNLAIQNEKTNLEKGTIWKYEATTSQIYSIYFLRKQSLAKAYLASKTNLEM